jgi:competence protein ComEA
MKIKVLLPLMIGTFLFAKVDINYASKKDLQSLNGIGVKKAEAIVKYRETNGCFKDISDIKKVRGVNSGLFDSIKNELDITPCTTERKEVNQTN